MGHAGAIISGGRGTAAEKYKALESAGAITVKNPSIIGETVEKILKGN
jgi:succinyl-CoA synthetase alpha subunit